MTYKELTSIATHGMVNSWLLNRHVTLIGVGGLQPRMKLGERNLEVLQWLNCINRWISSKCVQLQQHIICVDNTQLETSVQTRTVSLKIEFLPKNKDLATHITGLPPISPPYLLSNYFSALISH